MSGIPPTGAGDERVASPSPSAAIVVRRWPGWPARLVLALCAGMTIWMRGFSDYDAASRNVGTVLFVFIACMTMLVWFTLASGYPRRLRFAVPVLVLVVGGLAAASLKIDSFNGALIPRFRWRWLQAADNFLPTAEASAINVARLERSTQNDYPQFLGPARDGALPAVNLDHDWSKHPPELVWRRPIGAGWSAFATYGPLAVTLEQRGPLELVSCYAIATGELVWVQGTETRHESMLGGVGPRSTPTIDQGKVYTLGATGRLHCLDLASGTVLWKKNLLDEVGIASPERDMDNLPWGRAASPLVVENMVIVPAGGPTGGPFVSLVAYDADSGREVWRGGKEQIAYASPALYDLLGTPTVVIVNEASVTGHDLHSGAVLWREEWPGSSNAAASNSQCVALDERRLFVSKGYGEGCRSFEVSHGAGGDPAAWQTHDLWSLKRNMQTKFSNIVRVGDSIYGLSEGIFECIDQATGARRWKKGRYGYGQNLLVGDTILVVGETGELILVAANPKQLEELGRIQAIEGKTWNNLALCVPYLLVRNGQEAACYQMPLADKPAGAVATVDGEASGGDNKPMVPAQSEPADR